jgi:hypothetical protein
MAILQVTSPNNSGAGTLRDTIAAAASGDTIVFNVPGNQVNVSSIILIDKQLRIDGTATSPNTNPFPLPFNGGPNIVINGGGIITSFLAFAPGSDGSQLIDLSVINFAGTDTIVFAAAGTLSNYTIRGCFFGLDPTGNAISPGGNTFNIVTNATLVNNLYLGGPDARDRNILIPGNRQTPNGILSSALVSASSTSVAANQGYGNLIFEGNYIGVDKTGENCPITYANGIDFTANTTNVLNFFNTSPTNYSSGIIRKNLFGGMTRSTVRTPTDFSAITGIAIKLPYLSASPSLQTILIEDNLIGVKWDGESLVSNTSFLAGIASNARFTRIIGNQISGAGKSSPTDTSVNTNLLFTNLSFGQFGANTAGSNNFVSNNKLGVNKDGTKSLGESRYNISSDLYQIFTTAGFIINVNVNNGNNIYVKNIIGGATESNINNASHDLIQENYIGVSPCGKNLNEVNNTQNNITVLAAVTIIRKNHIAYAVNNIISPTNSIIEKNRIFNGTIGLNIGAAIFYQTASNVVVGEQQSIVRDNCFSDHNIGILVKNVTLNPPNPINGVITYVCASVTIERNKIKKQFTDRNSTPSGKQQFTE